MKKYPFLFLLILPACWGGLSCTKNSTSLNRPFAPSPTLLSTLQDNYAFSLFYHALGKAGLDSLLSGKGPYTLLVPDNDAFARDSILGDSALDKIDTGYLRKWMSYHILARSLLVADIPQAVNNPYTTITGQTLYFSRLVPNVGQSQGNTGGILHINGDTVNTTDIVVSNGVIQVMNRPLKLPVASVQAYLAGDTSYSYFVSALQRFGLWDQLTGPGPFTVFAPDNNAFTNLGITSDSLSRWDTLHYQTTLLGIYVLVPSRIFLTDFYDAGPGNGFGAFFTSNGLYWLSGGNLVDNYPAFGLFRPAPWTVNDIIAGNGVVQGIDGLLLIPVQATK